MLSIRRWEIIQSTVRRALKEFGGKPGYYQIEKTDVKVPQRLIVEHSTFPFHMRSRKCSCSSQYGLDANNFSYASIMKLVANGENATETRVQAKMNQQSKEKCVRTPNILFLKGTRTPDSIVRSGITVGSSC